MDPKFDHKTEDKIFAGIVEIITKEKPTPEHIAAAVMALARCLVGICISSSGGNIEKATDYLTLSISNAVKRSAKDQRV